MKLFEALGNPTRIIRIERLLLPSDNWYWEHQGNEKHEAWGCGDCLFALCDHGERDESGERCAQWISVTLGASEEAYIGKFSDDTEFAWHILFDGDSGYGNFQKLDADAIEFLVAFFDIKSFAQHLMSDYYVKAGDHYFQECFL